MIPKICSHPVLYNRGTILFCAVCGADVVPGGEVNKNSPETETPSEAPKTAAKRTRRKKADD